MKILPFLALAGALALSACAGRPDAPDASNPYGPGFDSSLLESVTPGGRGHLSAAQLEMRRAVDDTVLFTTDSSDLTPEAMRILDAQAAWLVQNAQYRIVVEGHADERGTRSYNLALGARRAEAAASHLVRRGVPQNRVETMSWGKEAPLETCPEERCWSANRRAVTMVR